MIGFVGMWHSLSVQPSSKPVVMALSLLTAPLACGPEFVEPGPLCDGDVSGITMRAFVSENVDDSIAASAVLDYGATERCDGDSMTINGVPAMIGDNGTQRFFTLDLPEAEDRTYTFVFHREDRDAPIVATVTMPEAFEMTAPKHGDVVSLADDLQISWGPSVPGTLELELIDASPNAYADTPDCFRYASENLDDDGEHLLPAGSIEFNPAYADYGDFEDCQLRVALTRTATGDYPAEFAPGVFEATRGAGVIVEPVGPAAP